MTSNTPAGCDGAWFPHRAPQPTEAQVKVAQREADAAERTASLHEALIEIITARAAVGNALSFGFDDATVELAYALDRAWTLARKAGGKV